MFYGLLIVFRMWCLIKLYDYDEFTDEKSPDLIPSDWIVNKFNCWYPFDYKMSTIKKYAKEKEQPDCDKWKKCKIDIIEENIGNLLILFNLMNLV